MRYEVVIYKGVTVTPEVYVKVELIELADEGSNQVHLQFLWKPAGMQTRINSDQKPYKSSPGGQKAEFGGICRSSFAALVGLLKRGLSWHHVDLFQRWMLDFLTHHISRCYNIRATAPPDRCFTRWIILL